MMNMISVDNNDNVDLSLSQSLRQTHTGRCSTSAQVYEQDQEDQQEGSVGKEVEREIGVLAAWLCYTSEMDYNANTSETATVH